MTDGLSQATIATALERSGGRPSGFDYMRITLAISVILIHSHLMAYGLERDADLWSSPLKPLVRLPLPMFFALSGFLVAGSFERSRTLGKFFALRGIRIYPALMVEVILSAFILGPIITSMSLRDYFSDNLFREYLWNIIGHVHYYLPGVFVREGMPSNVNGQLWTVPFELLCYISLGAIAVLGAKRWPLIAPAAALFVSSAWVLAQYFKLGSLPIESNGRVSGAILISCFLAGMSIYLYRSKIPWNKYLVMGSLIASLILLEVQYGSYASVFPVAYLTVGLGLTDFKRLKVIQGADYSYGIFICGYVIQKTLSELIPWSNEWYLNFTISVFCAGIFAAASWHLVEKPAMKSKHYIDKLEDRYLIWRAKIRTVKNSSGLTNLS